MDENSAAQTAEAWHARFDALMDEATKAGVQVDFFVTVPWKQDGEDGAVTALGGNHKDVHTLMKVSELAAQSADEILDEIMPYEEVMKYAADESSLN